jgi:SRSO17 transposase
VARGRGHADEVRADDPAPAHDDEGDRALIKERWRTERAYEELKGELGLDHFEGRSFPGWHHRVSVLLCCYAFIVSERVRHFPPSADDSARCACTIAHGAVANRA